MPGSLEPNGSTVARKGFDVAEAPKVKKKWIKPGDFHPGGKKGKLHREIGVPEGQKIPEAKLEAAAHSDNPEIKRDAIRAKTMKGWDHSGGKSRAERLYGSTKRVRRAG